MFKKVGKVLVGTAVAVASAVPAFALDTTVADMFAAADVSGLASSQKTMLIGFIVMAICTTAFAVVVSSLRKARGTAR